MSPTSQDISVTVSCRILVLSSSIVQATSFISRVWNCNSKPSSAHVETPQEATDTLDSDSDSASELRKIPWTITNKYYSALVHFAVQSSSSQQLQLQNVPAVIFVWTDGEPYRHHITRISRELAGYQPEVCLAVRVPAESNRNQDEHEVEDDIEIDGFLSAYGFEYIRVGDEPQNPVDAEMDDDLEEGIPSLPRLLDALSTIMWPSMQTSERIRPSGLASQTNQQRDRALLDWARSSQDLSIGLEYDQGPDTTKMMEKLTIWLDGDHLLRDDPWRSTLSISTSPTSMESPDPRKDMTPGFEDNFTIFVSAPPVDSLSSDRSTPDLDMGHSVGLGVPNIDVPYHLLGSDFGSDDGLDGEDDFPTQEEISVTCRRVFGDSFGGGLGNGKGAANSSSEQRVAGGLAPTEFVNECKMVPFDLSKVVGALQEMKAEIGMIEDEDERRKAATTLALGLVYGLEEDLR